MSTIKSIDFVSKLPEFDFNNIPAMWCEPRHLRVFWDAVSIITPEAEKYIMRSVRAYLNDPIVKENPWLEQLIDDFNAQERQHTFIHTELNKAMGIYEIDMRSRLQATMQELTKNLSNIENLAITAAMEHLFFSVIKLTFIDTGFYKDESVDAKVKKVFLWHWCEELEHHSVSINLLQVLDSSWQTRVKAAQKILTRFLPVCVEIIIDIERFYAPKHYRMHAAADIPKMLGYFRKGVGVTGKYFDASYDVIEGGQWSWAYIEQWRSQLGFAAPVKIIESGNIKLAL